MTITDEMVERAARAMHAEMGGLPDEFEQMHLEAARAALEAALTEDNTGWEAKYRRVGINAEGVPLFRAMRRRKAGPWEPVAP